MKPYVGVTGFMTQREVYEILTAIPPGLLEGRDLMVGVLVSSKTKNGGTNKYPGRYPKPEAIEEIFGLDFPSQLKLIHYTTDTPTTIYGELMEVSEICGYAHDGYQVNLAWPSPQELLRYRRHHAREVYGDEEAFHKVRMVLQIGSKALRSACPVPEDPFSEPDPERLSRLVYPYWDSGAASDILIDASGGRGEPFDPEKAKLYLAAIQTACPNLGLGVAGGLSAQAFPRLLPLALQFTNLSVDAEGKLRDPNDDHLLLDRAKLYVKGSLLLLGSS